MKQIGNLRKMSAELVKPINYSIVLGDIKILLNQYLDDEIQLRYTGIINCIACNQIIKKSYQQGYCYPCTRKLAQCDMCILKPELCHFHEGTCREPTWGEEHCMQPHVVYLSNTSGLKVGITRESQIPIRWIDQGAIQALPIVNVKSRYQSGLLEKAFSQFIADKTNWRKMLQGKIEKLDLAEKRDELLPEVAEQIQQISADFKLGSIELLMDEKIQIIEYPVIEYPEKIVSLNFDKDPIIKGKLKGVKGQYLIFDIGVINIRKFAGYEIEFSCKS